MLVNVVWITLNKPDDHVTCEVVTRLSAFIELEKVGFGGKSYNHGCSGNRPTFA